MATEIKQGFAPFVNFIEDSIAPYQKLLDLSNQVGRGLSRINHCYFWFSSDTITKKLSCQFYIIACLCNGVILRKWLLIWVVRKRPVYRLGWAFADSGLKWAKIMAAELDAKGSFASMPLDVYIQSHALLRLRERLDRIEEGSLHSCLYDSYLF
ncbi:hypothetical protein L0128_14525 [candidate division KSB1 bacterium]|nr:hypothetical protein [candidate division KSB1 bacterium]